MNSYKTRTLAAVLFISVVFSLCSVSFATDTESAYVAKIFDDVWENEPDENGLRSVLIVRRRISDADFEERFYNTHGYSTQDYEDWDTYYNVTEPALIKRFYEDNGIDPSVALEDLDSETRMALNTELSEDVDEYIRKSRAVKAALYEEYNNAFLGRHSIDRTKTQYVGMYTGSIIMLATEEQIYEFASDEEVVQISFWEDEVQYNHGDTIIQDLVTDAESETESLPAEETCTETEKETNKETAEETLPETAVPETDDGNEKGSGTVAMTIAAALILAVAVFAVIVMKKKNKN